MDSESRELRPGVRLRRRSAAAGPPTTAVDIRRHQPAGPGKRLLQGIGLLGVGLGLAQLVAPRAVQRLVGAPLGESTLPMRVLGVRELFSGLGILSGRQTKAFVGGRVVGNVLDLSLLAGTLRSPDASPLRIVATAVAVLGVGALDLLVRRALAAGR